ncbi:hypothetical protein [Streptomyces sp. NPDC007355]|uniref:hypothetical protein n=1 Tax=Streptomyces sp. NPDC007355 TaxID=3364778 RepID=UPI003681B0F6
MSGTQRHTEPLDVHLMALRDGYGAAPCPGRRGPLTVLFVLDSVSGIFYGTAHGDPSEWSAAGAPRPGSVPSNAP